MVEFQVAVLTCFDDDLKDNGDFLFVPYLYLKRGYERFHFIEKCSY